jgi:hypothetical protein
MVERVFVLSPHPLFKWRHVFLADDDLFVHRRVKLQLQFAPRSLFEMTLMNFSFS